MIDVAPFHFSEMQWGSSASFIILFIFLMTSDWDCDSDSDNDEGGRTWFLNTELAWLTDKLASQRISSRERWWAFGILSANSNKIIRNSRTQIDLFAFEA